jgi:hypothetical protein
MYVCMCVCMYVCGYACMYVCMYVCRCVLEAECGCIRVCMYVSMHVCIHARLELIRASSYLYLVQCSQRMRFHDSRFSCMYVN